MNVPCNSATATLFPRIWTLTVSNPLRDDNSGSLAIVVSRFCLIRERIMPFRIVAFMHNFPIMWDMWRVEGRARVVTPHAARTARTWAKATSTRRRETTPLKAMW
jgi:hypothetical protein